MFNEGTLVTWILIYPDDGLLTAITNIVAEVYLMVQKNAQDILVNSNVKTLCLVRIYLSRSLFSCVPISLYLYINCRVCLYKQKDW